MNTYYKDILKLIKPKFPNATINDIVKAERALRNPGYNRNNKITIELRKIMADYHNSNYNEFLKFMKVKENKIMKKSELKRLIKEEIKKILNEGHDGECGPSEYDGELKHFMGVKYIGSVSSEERLDRMAMKYEDEYVVIAKLDGELWEAWWKRG